MTTVLSGRHGGQGEVEDVSSIPRKSRLWQTLRLSQNWGGWARQMLRVGR